MPYQPICDSKYFKPLADILISFPFVTVQSFALCINKPEMYAREILTRFVKRNALKSHDIGHIPRGLIYMPRKLMIIFMAETYPHTERIVTSIDKLSVVRIAHDFLLQLEIVKNYGIETCRPNVIWNNHKRLSRIPDMVVEKNGKLVSVEFERSIKSVAMRNSVLANTVLVIKRNIFQSCDIITSSMPIYKSYEKILDSGKTKPMHLFKVKGHDVFKVERKQDGGKPVFLDKKHFTLRVSNFSR